MFKRQVWKKFPKLKALDEEWEMQKRKSPEVLDPRGFSCL
jgi:hypothetical protein